MAFSICRHVPPRNLTLSMTSLTSFAFLGNDLHGPYYFFGFRIFSQAELVERLRQILQNRKALSFPCYFQEYLLS